MWGFLTCTTCLFQLLYSRLSQICTSLSECSLTPKPKQLKNKIFVSIFGASAGCLHQIHRSKFTVIDPWPANSNGWPIETWSIILVLRLIILFQCPAWSNFVRLNLDLTTVKNLSNSWNIQTGFMVSWFSFCRPLGWQSSTVFATWPPETCWGPWWLQALNLARDSRRPWMLASWWDLDLSALFVCVCGQCYTCDFNIIYHICFRCAC